MFYLTRSVWYDCEYSFCQSDTFPELNQQVAAAHGVCAQCASDWMAAKYNNRSFVFAGATIAAKARHSAAAAAAGGNFAAVYGAANPTMDVGVAQNIERDMRGGVAIAESLDAVACAIIHISGTYEHALAACKVGGKYFMFDSNFGSYKCSYKKGVATWYANIMNCARTGRGTYFAWARNAYLYACTPH